MGLYQQKALLMQGAGAVRQRLPPRSGALLIGCMFLPHDEATETLIIINEFARSTTNSDPPPLRYRNLGEAVKPIFSLLAQPLSWELSRPGTIL